MGERGGGWGEGGPPGCGWCMTTTRYSIPTACPIIIFVEYTTTILCTTTTILCTTTTHTCCFAVCPTAAPACPALLAKCSACPTVLSLTCPAASSTRLEACLWPPSPAAAAAAVVVVVVVVSRPWCVGEECPESCCCVSCCCVSLVAAVEAAAGVSVVPTCTPPVACTNGESMVDGSVPL